jgi:hypothetical protein
MHPSVDKTEPRILLATVSTGENNEPGYSARQLIRTPIMRPTFTTLAIATTLAGCMQNVGDERGRPTRPATDKTCDNPTKVDKDVVIDEVADFDKLQKGCWDLYGKLSIKGSAITSVAKLGNLVGANELELIDTGLTTFDSAQTITVYGQVTITGNAKLTGLKNLTAVHADDVPFGITIADNPELASIDGIADITDLDTDLSVTNNPKLAALAFTKLKFAEASITISNNAALAHVDLSKLETVNRVDLTNNAALVDVSGFAATSIHGDVTVRQNPLLTMLGTMSSLTTIQGNLTIDNNAALTNIGAFTTSMHYVTGVVTITNNAKLTGLGQVSHLLGIGSLIITDNPVLSFCAAREVAACVNPPSVTIRNNLSASNCTSWCGK